VTPYDFARSYEVSERPAYLLGLASPASAATPHVGGGLADREPGSLRQRVAPRLFGDAEVVEHLLGAKPAWRHGQGHDRMLTQLEGQSDDNPPHVGLDQVVVADALTELGVDSNVPSVISTTSLEGGSRRRDCKGKERHALDDERQLVPRSRRRCAPNRLRCPAVAAPPVIYCADIGSVANRRFGWARTEATRLEIDRHHGGTEIGELVDAVSADLAAGRAVALGFECPLYLPVPEPPLRLGRAREGEGNRSWSAGAGAGALATGAVQAAWILRELRQRGPATPAYLDWTQFERAGRGLSLWEAGTR
jgi:hypothetical protein